MKIELDPKHSLDKAEGFIKAFGHAGKAGTARALNRAAQGVKTDAARETRKEYKIKARDIRDSLRISRATPNKLQAMALGSGNRIPLVKFGARPAQPGGRRPAKGISVHVKSRKVLKGSFVARTGSGHVGVFTRKGKASLPIEQKFGPAVPEMIGNPDVLERMTQGAKERFEKNLDHEINRSLEKLGVR